MNLFLQIVSLLILCGDIEQNPGPVFGSSTGGMYGCAEGCGGLEKSRVDGWIIWVG